MLEVFAKLNGMGESCGEDHIFIGSKRDFILISKWLGEQYLINKRKKKIESLEIYFKKGSQELHPCIRLTKPESRVLHEALVELNKNKKSAPLKKVTKILTESLWIY